jgi:hypothetical protein
VYSSRSEEFFDALNDGSKKWLQGFAADFGIPFEKLIRDCTNWVVNDEYFWYESMDSISTREFWNRFEQYSGLKVTADKRISFFSCSC